MIIHISPTPMTRTVNGLGVRLWVGHLDQGGSVTLWIARVGSGDPATQERLAAELQETPPPLSLADLLTLQEHVGQMVASAALEGGAR